MTSESETEPFWEVCRETKPAVTPKQRFEPRICQIEEDVRIYPRVLPRGMS